MTSLPPDWEKFVDDNGYEFFHNRVTDVSQWDPPPAAVCPTEKTHVGVPQTGPAPYGHTTLSAPGGVMRPVEAVGVAGQTAAKAYAGRPAYLPTEAPHVVPTTENVKPFYTDESVSDVPESLESWSSSSSSEDEFGHYHHHRVVHHHSKTAKPAAEETKAAAPAPRQVKRAERAAQSLTEELKQSPCTEDKAQKQAMADAAARKAQQRREEHNKRMEVEKQLKESALELERQQSRHVRLYQKAQKVQQQAMAKIQNLTDADAQKKVQADVHAKLQRLAGKIDKVQDVKKYAWQKFQAFQRPSQRGLSETTMQTPLLPAALKTPGSINLDVCLAEFTGTFIWVFVVGNASAACNYAATAIACALMVGVYATAGISGGHLNPAVTFFVALSNPKQFSTWDVVQYWCAQLLGGGLASILFTTMLGGIKVGPRTEFGWPCACAAEFMYTFMLCFVVGCCAVSKKNNPDGDGNQFFGLAIGFVIIAGGFAVGPISGACFNPAVSIGLAMLGGGKTNAIIYTLFEMSGAAVAYIVYSLVRPKANSQGDATPFSKLLGEFLGTFLLAITVSLNILVGSPATAFSAAAAFMCMVYSLGNVSGGHLNPAVTVAVVLSGRDKCTPKDGVCYIVAQMCAGCLAGLIPRLLCNDKSYTMPIIPGSSIPPAAAAELIFTFVLAFVVLAVATTKPAPSLSKMPWQYALAIGSCVTAGGFASGGVSGGYLNPAVTFGASFLGATDTHFTAVWLSTFQFVGGALAAIIFELFTHQKEFGKDQWYSCYIAEFLGTFVWMFTIGCCPPGDWKAFAIACSLMVMTYALRDISGAHLNPAVSFFAGLLREVPPPKVFGYMVMQLLGGLLAAKCSLMLTGSAPEILKPMHDYTWIGAGFVETLYTGMLCLVVGCVAISKKNNPAKDKNGFFGLAIGFVIVAGGYAAGSISGACFNPAVSISLGLMGSGMNNFGFLYALFELAGAGIAACLYFLTGLGKQGDRSTVVESLISEFLGTFVLVVTVGLNILSESSMTAWSAAAALMCMIYSLGCVSGAHFNPAVTLAVLASDPCCLHGRAFSYWVVQVVAAICGGITFGKFRPDYTCRLSHGEHPVIVACIAELIFTFVLAFVVLAVATDRTKGLNPRTPTTQNHFFGLAIGMCMVAAWGAIPGGELNPSVALGISMGCGFSSDLPLFVLSELVGGVLAAAVFEMIWKDRAQPRRPVRALATAPEASGAQSA